MNLFTNKISTGKAPRFEDFVAKFEKNKQIKTASVKVAEQDEADSSEQLDVESLHQDSNEKSEVASCDCCKVDDCGGGCGCKSCTASVLERIKEAGVKGTCSECGKPNFLGCDCSGEKDSEDKEDDVDDKKDDVLVVDVLVVDDKEDDDKKDDDKKDDDKKDDDKKDDNKEASSMEFVKLANLDSKNKSFLAEYWRTLFGDEYVNAIIADK